MMCFTFINYLHSLVQSGFTVFQKFLTVLQSGLAGFVALLAIITVLMSMISCTATVPYRKIDIIDAYVHAPIKMLDGIGQNNVRTDSPLRPAEQEISADHTDTDNSSFEKKESIKIISETKAGFETDVSEKTVSEKDSPKKIGDKTAGANVESVAEKSEPDWVSSLQSGLPPANAVYEPRLEIGDQVRVSFYQRPVVQKEAYQINPNDILSVDVLDHPELSRASVLVLPDGYISVPLADRIQASGKSTDKLGFEIGQRLNDHKISDPVVSVAVQRSQSALVGLMAMLQSRDGREPLTYIVDGAGTLDLPLIDPVSTVLTLREIRKQIKEAYLRSVGPLLEVSIEVQPVRPLAVYVVGEVGRPGNVNFEVGLHPFMAVSSVGGFLPTADLKEVRLFRADANGQLQQWHINMASEDELFAQGVKLLPRDILFVPRSGIAEANKRMDLYVRRLLPFNLGVGANYNLNNQ